MRVGMIRRSAGRAAVPWDETEFATMILGAAAFTPRTVVRAVQLLAPLRRERLPHGPSLRATLAQTIRNRALSLHQDPAPAMAAWSLTLCIDPLVAFMEWQAVPAAGIEASVERFVGATDAEYHGAARLFRVSWPVIEAAARLAVDGLSTASESGHKEMGAALGRPAPILAPSSRTGRNGEVGRSELNPRAGAWAREHWPEQKRPPRPGDSSAA
jgi:hypothetical protein